MMIESSMADSSTETGILLKPRWLTLGPEAGVAIDKPNANELKTRALTQEERLMCLLNASDPYTGVASRHQGWQASVVASQSALRPEAPAFSHQLVCRS